MNWTKILIVTAAGGFVMWLYSFITHGMMLGNTYAGMPEVFVPGDQGNPISFLVVQVFVVFAGAMLFAKTRGSWDEGAKGGAMFGFYLGLVPLFASLMNPMIFADFPYYLGWCWGTISLIGWTLVGALAGVLYKRTDVVA
ncbi:MAG: hypothetical protein ACRBF0_14195 [Calditrichia bacterium]